MGEKLTTHEYEMLVTERREGAAGLGKVLREAQEVTRASGLLVRPTREALLLKHADKLNAFQGDQAIERPEYEVAINIRPFCG